MVIGHCDMVPDHDYHLESRGAGVRAVRHRAGGERVRHPPRLDWIRSLAEEGYLDRVLLSQDVCLRSTTRPRRPGYAYVVTGFADRLRDEGFEKADLDQLLVDNPRRMLTGE